MIKSIFAGVMIGIACVISSKVGSWQGAFAFSIGLIVICLRGYSLYTGKIGYISGKKHILDNLLILIGNLAGIVILSGMAHVDTTEIMALKLSAPLYMVFLKAVGCGFLMYIAVDIFKQRNSIIGCICCVPAFILCGFEHSIADMYYLLNSDVTWYGALFLLIAIIGNGIGANLHKLEVER